MLLVDREEGGFAGVDSRRQAIVSIGWIVRGSWRTSAKVGNGDRRGRAEGSVHTDIYLFG